MVGAVPTVGRQGVGRVWVVVPGECQVVVIAGWARVAGDAFVGPPAGTATAWASAVDGANPSGGTPLRAGFG